MNNDDELEKRFRDEAAEFSLTPDEKARMRRVVSAYAAMKPVRRPAAARAVMSRWHVLVFSPRMAVGVLAVVLVASSAGVSYAAESALPGDFLYMVKVKVNESVAQALSTSPQAKAQTAAKLAHRRLDEAAKLAAQGRLGTSTRVELQEGFETHVAEAVSASASASTAAAEPATSTLAALDRLLSEEEDKLARLEASTTELAPVIASVKAQRVRVAESRDAQEGEHDGVAVATIIESKKEDKKQDAPRVATAKRSDAHRGRDSREEIRRRPTATLAATTTATTTAVVTEPVSTSTEDKRGESETFINATVRAGENAGSFISKSVRAYLKQWSDDSTSGQDSGKKGKQGTEDALSHATSTSDRDSGDGKDGD